MKAKYVPPTVVSGRAASRSRVRPERRGRVMRMARPSSVSSSLSSMYLANEQFYATKWPLKSHQKLHTWYLGNTFNRFFFCYRQAIATLFCSCPKVVTSACEKNLLWTWWPCLQWLLRWLPPCRPARGQPAPPQQSHPPILISTQKQHFFR